MCQTYDKSEGGDTKEPQSRMVPPQKKLGRVTLNRLYVTNGYLSFRKKSFCCKSFRHLMNPKHSGNLNFFIKKKNRKKPKLKKAGDPLPQFSTFISTLNYEELSILTAVAIQLEISSRQGAVSLVTSRFCSRESQCWKQHQRPLDSRTRTRTTTSTRFDFKFFRVFSKYSSFSPSRNKKINRKPSSGRIQENEML